MTKPTTRPERIAMVRSYLALIWRIARPILGWGLIAVGIAGCILPVLPGIPLMVAGMALVGRRNVVIRWCAVKYKLLVRRWAALPHPWVRRMGRWALVVQQETSRQRRRLYWWHRDRQRATG